MCDILGLVLASHLLFYANEAIDKQKQIVEHGEGATPWNKLTTKLNNVNVNVRVNYKKIINRALVLNLNPKSQENFHGPLNYQIAILVNPWIPAKEV